MSRLQRNVRRPIALILTLVLTLSLGFSTIPPARAAGNAAPINGYLNSFSGLSVGSSVPGWTSTGTWSIVEGAAAPSWGGDGHDNWNRYYRNTAGSDVISYQQVYTDFDYTSGMRIDSGSSGAVVFRLQDENNYYFFRLVQAGRVELGKVQNGVETILGTRNTSINSGDWYQPRVIVRGNSIECWLLNGPHYRPEDPGVRHFNITDSTFTSGKNGFRGAGTLYNGVGISDLAQDRKIENDTYELITGPYGQIKSLKLKNEPYDTNFVVNEETHRVEIGANKFFGELKFAYSVDGGSTRNATTGGSVDVREISQTGSSISVNYATPSANTTDGIRDFQVSESYSLVGDYIQFDFTVKNTSGSSVKFLDIGLPITWNNHWQYGSPYERYVNAAANYISYNGSYVELERAKGGGNKLLFMPNPETDTKLEYRKFTSTTNTFMNPPEEYYIYSDAVKSGGQGYLPSTSLTLAANESKTFSFRFYKSESYLDSREILYQEGSISANVNPGLIMPRDVTAKVDLRTMKDIVSITSAQDTGFTYKLAETRPGNHKIYEFTFTKLGRNDITVTYDTNKKTVLQFWIQEPIRDALQRRADFLIEKCRITDPADPHYKGFLEWNNATNTAKTGGNNCNNNDYEQMYDGPGFLLEKNVFYPVQSEISILDDYLIDLVYAKEVIDDGGVRDGYLSHACCRGRCWDDDSPNTEAKQYWCHRPFNYPRMYNAFYSMYKIATLYSGMTTRWEAAEYLRIAGKLAITGIKEAPGMGTMGEQTVVDIIAALETEGFTSIASDLRTRALSKSTNMNNQTYPFGSEFGTDNTAEEGAYFYSKMGNRKDGMKKTIDKIFAWKGRSPVWYWQTTGNRQDNDWWLFQYTVAMHGAALHDWYFNEDPQGVDYWSMIYPYKYAGYVHINSGQPELIGGAAGIGSNWGNYMSTRPYNWSIGFPYSESAESDMSLWAGLQITSADVVLQDPSFGLTGYGCVVDETTEAYEIEPHDGLFRRLNVVDNKWQMEMKTDRYLSAQLRKDFSAIKLEVENATQSAHAGIINFRGLKPGKYDVWVNGTYQGSAMVASSVSADISYQLGTQLKNTVEIKPNDKPNYATDFSSDDGRWVAFGGVWNVTNGVLNGNGNGKRIVDDVVFGDLVYEADVKINSATNWGGLLLRVSEPGSGLEEFNGYCISLSAVDEGTKGLFISSHPGWNVEAHVRAPNMPELVLGQTYHMVVTMVGNVMRIYIDGEAIGNADQKANGFVMSSARDYRTGKIGARVYGTNIDYDNLAADTITADTPIFLKDPKSLQITEGDMASFSSSAVSSGGTVAFTWQYSKDALFWVDIEGANANTYSIPAATETNAGYYRLVATKNGEIAYSDAAQLTLFSNIQSVVISPAEPSVIKGQTLQFTAAVTGPNNPSQDVTWSVSGNSSSGTFISTSGLLTVGEDELRESFTVTAVSKKNAFISDSVEVSVFQEVRVDDVTVSPAIANVTKGKSATFSAAVTGVGGHTQNVTWTVEGATSDGTTITSGGVLTVASNESSPSITVKATSVDPPHKFGTATVRTPAPVNRSDLRLDLTFDEGEGDALIDHSANNYPVRMNGPLNWRDDGFAFGGSNSLKLTGAALVNPDMTIVYRMKRTGNPTYNCSLFWGMNQSDWNGNGMWINMSATEPVFVASSGFNTFAVNGSSSTFFPLNEFVEVAVVINSSTGEYDIYRNGVKQNIEKDGPKNIRPPSNPYNTIGMAGYDNEFLNNFTMDKYMIFGKALSDSDVMDVYEGKLVDDEPVVEAPVITASTVPALIVKGIDTTLGVTATTTSGAALTYAWTVSPVIAGNTVTGANTAAPTVNFGNYGTYRISVVVTDIYNQTATQTWTVAIGDQTGSGDPIDMSQAAAYTSALGNVAPLGTAYVTGITNQWQTQPDEEGKGGSAVRINDGLLHTGGTHSGSWNAHGSASGSESNVDIRWTEGQTVDSLRVQWSYDTTSGTGGVQLPANVAVQYWNGTDYVPVTNMKSGTGTNIGQTAATVGVDGSGTGATNVLWNGVTFDAVTTTRIRLVITNGGNGVGISEFEIFKVQTTITEPVDKSALLAAITAFEALNQSDWSVATWAAAGVAYTAAKAVFVAGDATVTGVDAATSALLAAIDALLPNVPAPIITASNVPVLISKGTDTALSVTATSSVALTYAWTVSPVIEGNTVTGANTAAPTVNFGNYGTYLVSVVVTDTYNQTATQTWTVAIGDQSGSDEPIDMSQAAPYTSALGNVAPLGTAYVTGITNQWQTQPDEEGKGGSTVRINDGLLHTGGTHTGSWNAYGMATDDISNVDIRWSNAQTVNSLRVQWSYDQTEAGAGGVQLPSNVAVQYWNGTEYVTVTNMKSGTGTNIGQTTATVGVDGSGTGAANVLWNGVTFDAVTTTRIRLVITNGNGGVGISEFEIFGSRTVVTEPVDKSALLAAITAFEALNQYDWSISTWTAAGVAYTAAKSVFVSGTATAAEVATAASALITAIDALAKTQLPLGVEVAVGKTVTLDVALTDSSTEAAAIATIDGSVITGVSVGDTTYTGTFAPFTSVLPGTVSVFSMADLYALITSVEALNEDDYTPASWLGLAVPLAAANAVKTNPVSPTKAAYESVRDALQAAVVALVEKTPDPEYIDTTDLEALLADADALDEADYTAATWTVLAAAVDAAELWLTNVPYEDTAANLADYSALKTALQAAMDGLEEAIPEPDIALVLKMPSSLKVARAKTITANLTWTPANVALTLNATFQPAGIATATVRDSVAGSAKIDIKGTKVGNTIMTIATADGKASASVIVQVN